MAVTCRKKGFKKTALSKLNSTGFCFSKQNLNTSLYNINIHLYIFILHDYH